MLFLSFFLSLFFLLLLQPFPPPPFLHLFLPLSPLHHFTFRHLDQAGLDQLKELIRKGFRGTLQELKRVCQFVRTKSNGEFLISVI